MKKRSWAAVLVLGVLSRLVTINGAPPNHLQARPMSVGDEQQIERMYEMLDSHQKRAAAAAAASAQQAPARRDTRTDADTDGEAHTENLPKFHYEVHHVSHHFGHRTPADVKLRDVARHAATMTADDEDDDDDDDETEMIPAAAAEHLISDNTVHHSSAPDRPRSTRTDEIDSPAIASDDNLLQSPAEKKLEDEQPNYDSDPPLKQAVLRDSVKNDYYEDYDSIDNEPGKTLAVRSSAGNVPGSISDVYFIAVIIGCSVAGLAGILVAAVCWFRLHKRMKATSDVDYPAYGVTGPAQAGSKEGSPGDRKLAQSAQMYHYQHQKQQMIASERVSSHEATQHVDGGSDDGESDDDNEDGDYTVFECRGLATNGEMEVRNPLFNDGQGSPTDDAAASQAKK